MNIRKFFLYIPLGFFLFAGCAAIPGRYIDISSLTAEKRISHNRKVFNRIEKLVSKKYYDPSFNGKDWASLTERYRDGAISSQDNKTLYNELNIMLNEMDSSHLQAIMMANVKDLFREYKDPVAAGFSWQVYDGRAVVVYIAAGSLADRSGIKKGWILLRINGEFPLKEIQDADAGEETYKVPLLDTGKSESYTFLDQENLKHRVTLTPEKGQKKPFLWLMDPYSRDYDPIEAVELPGGYLYLHIRNFISAKVKKSMIAKLDEHPDTPGIILDLRNNIGGKVGYMKMALRTFFNDTVNGGTIIGRSKKSMELKIKPWHSKYCSKPIVLLTNSRTICAAEMFAHIIKHYNRGKLVGRHTRGDVLGSDSYSLPGGGLLTIPVLNFIGLDGMQIEGKGVSPDITVQEPTLSSLRAGRDLDLEAALKILEEEKAVSGHFVNSGFRFSRKANTPSFGASIQDITPE